MKTPQGIFTSRIVKKRIEKERVSFAHRAYAREGALSLGSKKFQKFQKVSTR